MFESKSVSYDGGKKVVPISPIQLTPLNGDDSDEPQLRRILSERMFIESESQDVK
jgi:hypothetical protein